ncbi:MAG: hypothetical protein IMF11_09050 [Proteobacteria bacterium]|nr:hypothetical protein [Pseudomonadota bacterium]
MRNLHLDSEYRNRYIKFHLANGTIEDSRLKNWRQVAWDQVVCLSAHLLSNIHQVDCKGQGFKAFMNFRWGGEEAGYGEDGKYVGHKKIHIWTIGWTDGHVCYLKDIDFYTGELIKDYAAPLYQFKGHLHPLIDTHGFAMIDPMDKARVDWIPGIDSGSCN